MTTVLDIRKRQAKWDLRMLDKASFISQWSKDPSTKCGAVIVRDLNVCIQEGYNGYPPGVDDDGTLHVREQKYSRIIHAEVNAIVLAKKDLTGCTLYVFPLPPCDRCAGVIIQAGITRVVSVIPQDEERAERWSKVNAVAMDMFNKAGVEFVAYPESFVPKYDFPKTDVTLEWENLRLFGKRTS